jgi:lipopolysaccharide transport system permease protein
VPRLLDIARHRVTIVDSMNETPIARQRYELVIRPYSIVSLADLGDIWRHRELLWTLTARDIRVRYKQAVFGILWAAVQPLTQMIIFTILFSRLAGIRADAPVPYALFCLSGAVIWTLFSTGLAQASSSLVEHERVISKVYFPRIIIPLSSVLVAGMDFLIGLVLLLIAVPFFGVSLHLSIIFIPMLMILAVLCALAIGFWTSAINIQFRDVRYALPFFLQLLIYVTPVFYPSSLVPERYRFVLLFNPMSAVVDGFRAALFGLPLPWARLGLSFIAALVVALAGFLYFRRMEQTFADQV